MQIRKIYSVIIILFIASVPARAESVAQSLEKLIERNKVTAIRLAKEYIKVHLRDSLKEYKGQLKNIEKLSFKYSPRINLKKEARNYNGTLSFYSLLNTEYITQANVHVQYFDTTILILSLINNKIVACEASSNYLKGREHFVRAKENIQKFYPKVILQESYIDGDKIYVCKYNNLTSGVYKPIELDSYFEYYKQMNRAFSNYIMHEGFLTSYLSAISDSLYKPLGKTDLSNLRTKYDSIQAVYLSKYKEDSGSYFLNLLYHDRDGENYRHNVQKLKTYGFTIDQLHNESNDLSFKLKVKLKTNNSIKKYIQYDDLTKYTNIDSIDQSDVLVMVFFKGEKIGYIPNINKSDSLILIYKDYEGKEYSLWEYDNSELYFELDCPSSSLYSVNNQFYISYGFCLADNIEYKDLPRYSLPYEQFIEQVIDEYYQRKDYGK